MQGKATLMGHDARAMARNSFSILDSIPGPMAHLSWAGRSRRHFGLRRQGPESSSWDSIPVHPIGSEK